MRTYTANSFSKFSVQERIEVNGRPYLRLSDGYKETFRVQAYDFQVEWEESLVPEVIDCYVKKVNEFGLPLLEQSKREVYESLYSSEDFYPFTVISKDTDKKTGTTYYALKDPHGIYHRFYVNDVDPDKEERDVFSLWVYGIEDKGDNKVYLKLDYFIDKEIANKNIETTSSEDPRTESKFGFEGEKVEFKSSIVYPAGGIEPDIDKQIQIITKTIAGFQNADGGKLYIGVNDSGNVIGIKHDLPFINSSEVDDFSYPKNKDGYQSKIRISIKKLLGNISNSKVNISFDSDEDKEYCLIDIQPSDYPVFMQGIKLFQRAGNMTQLLRGEDITYFVETKWRERNHMNNVGLDNVKITEPIDDEEIKPNTESLDDKEAGVNNFDFEDLKLSNTKAEDIWKYIHLYKNGNWLFSTRKNENKSILESIPIYKCQKKGLLVIAYDNGRVNVVSIQNLISPKGKSGKRKMRTVNKEYKVGWFTEANMINVFVANAYDLLAFKSTTDDGKEWVKLHRVADISVHDINAQGNVLINERLDDAEINFCEKIPEQYYHLISGLVLKDTQTSSSLGYPVNDKDLKKTIQLVFKIIDNLRG